MYHIAAALTIQDYWKDVHNVPFTKPAESDPFADLLDNQRRSYRLICLRSCGFKLVFSNSVLMSGSQLTFQGSIPGRHKSVS